MGTPRFDVTKVRVLHTRPNFDTDAAAATATSGHKDDRMSAQRFNLSTKLRSRSNLAVKIEPVTAGEPSSSCSRIHKSWTDFPARRYPSPAPSETENGSTAGDRYFLVIRTADTPLSNHSTTSVTLDDTTTLNDTPCKVQEVDKGKGRHIEEVEEEKQVEEDETDSDDDDDDEEYTTTCTIIRPLPRSPFRSFFSRSPSSSAHPPHSSAPSLNRRFHSFSCFTRTDTFEEQVDYLQAKRARELSGATGMRIWVTQTREIHAEESWRQLVQELLYNNPGGGGPHIGPVIGRGD